MVRRWWILLPLTGCGLLFGDEEDEGQSDPDVTVQPPPVPSDLDEDGFTSEAGDCDDTDPTVFPGADETCDGVDEDCNGTVDDAPVDGTTYYRDDDQDGFGDDDVTLVACARPDGYALLGGDCDDTRSDVNPEAEDLPGEDSNCDDVPGTFADAIVSFDVTCVEDVDVTFDVVANGFAASGIVYMADTGNSASFGDEHDLFPAMPGGGNLDDDLTVAIGVGADFQSIGRNVATVFNCANFFDSTVMTYAVAIFDDADVLIDCIVTGDDPGELRDSFFPEAGLPPSFDTETCRTQP